VVEGVEPTRRPPQFTQGASTITSSPIFKPKHQY
jgi:hypothetical protein